MLVDYDSLLIIIGHQRPSLKYLNRHVRKPVGSKWYDLGVDLLEQNDVNELTRIQSDHPTDSTISCRKMFELWLDKQPEASWNQLIQSLRQPGIELFSLATDIEKMLQPRSPGTYIIVFLTGLYQNREGTVNLCMTH